MEALVEVIPLARGRPAEAFYDFNAQIGKMYSWMNVTTRTERVYDSIANTPIRSALDRMKRSVSCRVTCRVSCHVSRVSCRVPCVP
jgi:hypothetical protein